MINWNATKEDIEMISKIANRAVKAYPQLKKIDVDMAVTATHLNGCPLDLKKLLDADESNFIHDIGGIRQHLDRNTGKLMDCFLPRCSA